jgi:outer membrane lipoprotein-sorting protein
MPTFKHLSRLVIASFLLPVLVWPGSAHAQSSIPQELIESRLNLSQILDRLVEKNAERADALQKYQGRRTYSLVYTGFPSSFHAQMVVDMTYDAPATKQFRIVSQNGSQWIIDRVLKRLLEAEQEALSEENRQRVALNSRNYDFSGLERQDAPDTCSYVVAVRPKIPNKLLYRGRIWVDSKDFAVCRIEAEPAKNPSFWIKKTDIHHSYVKIGDFWLPSENESVSTVRGGGHAVLTIQYQDYEILAARGLKGSEAGPSSISLALPVHPN